MKRILSCLLTAIICLLPLAACSKDGTPKGMYNATVEGEPFILYVPEGWTDNRDSGFSSAYYSLSEAVTVSARSYAGLDGGVTLDKYVGDMVATYSEQYPSYSLVGKKGSALGNKEATRIEFTFDRVMESFGQVNNTKMLVIQYYAAHNGDIVVLSLYSTAEAYAAKAEYAEAFEQIRAEFVLCDRATSQYEAVTDKKTPEGMKIASNDVSEYRLYVPSSWICNPEDKYNNAYVYEGGPNVSVTSFSPDSAVSAREYFTLAQETYKKDIAGYELLGEEERKVAECDGVSYTYKAVYGMEEYKIMQTVLVYNGLVYSVTYTATAYSFDAHLADVNTILDSFRFR